MTYFAVKLNDTNYLGAKRGETVGSIEEARCYKNQKAAEKAAKGYQVVPWFENAKVVGRELIEFEFGGSYFKETELA